MQSSETSRYPRNPLKRCFETTMNESICQKPKPMEAVKTNMTPGDHLLLDSEENKSFGAGIAKRKELHGITPIRALSGTWGQKLDEWVDFFGYRISFTCSIADVKFSSLLLLVESKLDDDLEDIEMELCFFSNSVKCSVSSSVELHLDGQQIAKAKCFQELFFNGIYGKLYLGSKQSGEPREFLLETNKQLWRQSYMFLLLPLESLEPLIINWREIDSCVSVVEFIKKHSIFRAKKPKHDADSDSDMIHFANRSVHKDKVKQVLVLAIHTGEIYSVLEVLQDETVDSPFDGHHSKLSSFTDYLKNEYGIHLKHPEQHLLLLKQSHRSCNLLVDLNGISQLHGYKMPPELLVIIDARVDVINSLYLLPALMHRLESLMLSSQLREEINGHSTIGVQISVALILEAITTLRCNENFSMERLELLGDSVLKYAVSCDLYLRYTKKHEGQMSFRRSMQVCNSSLCNLGRGRGLQGYIRDSAFDPTKWTAPGQLPLQSCPCDHGIQTIEVPIDTKFETEDPKITTGKCCDMGHRWLGSKKISDCVEALVGAYFVSGGLTGALHCMKWIGVNCELDPSHINEAIEIASLRAYTPKLDVMQSLELKLGYQFVAKGLLLEAITHSSDQDQGVGYCYQRLEFLGDSVLDLLITWHLYKKHNDIDPGELTELRASSVNNENFAHAAVRRNLHQHLQYRSEHLQTQIAEYEKFVATSSTDTNSLQTVKSPKALGDLFESIAGAILIDTKLNLDEVWRIFEPLLSPIVTPDKLELAPVRKLIEMCDSMGYSIKDSCTNKGDTANVKLWLELKDALLSGVGAGPTRTVARGQAALRLLRQLELQGITMKNEDQQYRDGEIDHENVKLNNTTMSKPEPDMNTEILFNPQRAADTSNANETNSKVEIPVLKSIDTQKGGPRTSLYELCMKMQWPKPVLTSSEHKAKSLIEIGDSVDKRTSHYSFESHISLTIPNYGVIEVIGNPQADKKSSLDSAALLMLKELHRRGKLKIG